MAVTTLENTRWRLNQTVAPFGTSSNTTITISFRTVDHLGNVLGGAAIIFYDSGSVTFRVSNIYGSLENYSAFNYGTIRAGYTGEIFIAGGAYETNPAFIAWLEANATHLPTVSLQEKEVTPTNEEQEITPDAGFDGLSKVTVAAAIPTLQNKEVTPSDEEQEVTPDEGFDGLGKVTVRKVEHENLIPENVKHDVDIFDVTGTFSGFDPADPIAQMTNLAGSGQDGFVKDWSEMAKIMLHEQGVSFKFLESDSAKYVLAKAVTDLIEDGNLTSTTLSLVATLRVNHPHSEDEEVEPNV